MGNDRLVPVWYWIQSVNSSWGACTTETVILHRWTLTQTRRLCWDCPVTSRHHHCHLAVSQCVAYQI